MDNSNPYRAPTSEIALACPAWFVHWGVVLGYGAALFGSDVLVAIFEPRDSLFGGFWAALTAQAIIFAFLAYRLPSKPLVHCLLAICFEYLLGLAIGHGLSLYNLATPPAPVLLNIIHWAITGLALVAGLIMGLLLKRLRAGPNNSFKPKPLRGSA